MAYCTECGIQITEHIKFCSNCGEKISDIYHLNGGATASESPAKSENYAGQDSDEKSFSWENIKSSVIIGIMILAAVIGFKSLNISTVSGNELEKITVLGAGTSKQFDQFKDNGGLNTESSWHGFRVKSLDIGFDDNNFTKGYTIYLGILGYGETDANTNNVKKVAPSFCGSDWTRDANERFVTLLSANEKCLIQSETQKDYITLMVGDTKM